MYEVSTVGFLSEMLNNPRSSFDYSWEGLCRTSDIFRKKKVDFVSWYFWSAFHGFEFRDVHLFYDCPDSESDQSDDVRMAAEAPNVLKSDINWGKRWLVDFNACKTKITFITHL